MYARKIRKSQTLRALFYRKTHQWNRYLELETVLKHAHHLLQQLWIWIFILFIHPRLQHPKWGRTNIDKVSMTTTKSKEQKSWRNWWKSKRREQMHLKKSWESLQEEDSQGWLRRGKHLCSKQTTSLMIELIVCVSDWRNWLSWSLIKTFRSMATREGVPNSRQIWIRYKNKEYRG